MKALLTAAALVCIGGCSTPTKPLPRAPVRLEEADVQIADRFLNSLFRPHRSSYKVISDAAAADFPHIPVAERNRELQSRLSRLRQGPNPIRLLLHSGDRPTPGGSDVYVFVYDRRDGSLREMSLYDGLNADADTFDLHLDIRHWPDGTRLACVSRCWLNDTLNNIFHLRRGETTFRYAIAALQVD